MADKVDYSAFYYKKTGGTPPPAHPTEKIKTVRDELNEPKPKKKRKWLKTIVILSVCFAVVFVCADFFGKGFLTDAVCSIFSENEYNFYVLSENVSSRFVAYANSVTMREKGGAGYIFSDEEGYYVALSVYTDKQKASAVQDKNSNSVVYTLQIKTDEEEIMDALCDMVADFCDGLTCWEKGEATDKDMTEVCNRHKLIFESLQNSHTEQESLFSLIGKGLEEFSFASTDRLTGLSTARYFICSVLFSAKECL